MKFFPVELRKVLGDEASEELIKLFEDQKEEIMNEIFKTLNSKAGISVDCAFQDLKKDIRALQTELSAIRR